MPRLVSSFFRHFKTLLPRMRVPQRATMNIRAVVNCRGIKWHVIRLLGTRLRAREFDRDSIVGIICNSRDLESRRFCRRAYVSSICVCVGLRACHRRFHMDINRAVLRCEDETPNRKAVVDNERNRIIVNFCGLIIAEINPRCPRDYSLFAAS